jgi:hypothetical protein
VTVVDQLCWPAKATLRLAVAKAGRPAFDRPAKIWIARESSDPLSLLRALLDAAGRMVIIHHLNFVNSSVPLLICLSTVVGVRAEIPCAKVANFTAPGGKPGVQVRVGDRFRDFMGGN